MILVDTSVWIDHLRIGNEALVALFNESRVLMHPFVLGGTGLRQHAQSGRGAGTT